MREVGVEGAAEGEGERGVVRRGVAHGTAGQSGYELVDVSYALDWAEGVSVAE